MNKKPPTILTNLQRGNVKQESPMLMYQRSIHELAAQGELYEIEPQMLNALDTNNMTPLHWASGYGQDATVELLIRSGADPNLKSNGGATPLMLAASKGFFHVIKTLVAEGADLNLVDDMGNSALMYAAYQDHALVIQELVKNGADLSLANIYGQTAYGITLLQDNKASQSSVESHLFTLLKRRLTTTGQDGDQ